MVKRKIFKYDVKLEEYLLDDVLEKYSVLYRRVRPGEISVVCSGSKFHRYVMRARCIAMTEEDDLEYAVVV